jgi:sugar O-acyltransferase (sialic acid O-acetyltransferase NeuD family)
MKVVIIGAGGHGRVVLDILRQEGAHEVSGFVDSNPGLQGRWVDGVEVLGPPQALAGVKSMGIAGAIVAVGDSAARRMLFETARRSGLELINAVHPSANLAGNAVLGRGVVVAAGALVCAHCRIGDAAILNTGCIIDHETVVGPACHICPGARIAGRVSIGAGAFIGIGATVIQRVHIGPQAIVGAGAVVLQDVAARTTVVGVPAREIRVRAPQAGSRTDPREPLMAAPGPGPREL